MCLRIKHRHSDYIKIKEMMHTRCGGQFLTLSLLWKKKRKKRMKKGNKEGREEVKCLAYIWITSDTNFIPFSMYKSHSGITASWLKTPICNLTYILDGLYKWTCLHMCWQYWSKKRLNYLFTERKKLSSVVPKIEVLICSPMISTEDRMFTLSDSYKTQLLWGLYYFELLCKYM